MGQGRPVQHVLEMGGAEGGCIPLPASNGGCPGLTVTAGRGSGLQDYRRRHLSACRGEVGAALLLGQGVCYKKG